MSRTLRVFSSTVVCASAAFANTIVNFQVSNYAGKPIPGVILTAKVSSTTSPPTDVAGKTQIILNQDMQPGDAVPLVLVRPEKLRMFVPWQGRAIIPKGLWVEVVLGEPGQAAALLNTSVVASLAGAINSEARQSGGDRKGSKKKGGKKKEETPPPSKGLSLSQSTFIQLEQAAEAIGLDPVEVDAAIRRMAKETKNGDQHKEFTRYDATLPRDRMQLFRNGGLIG